MRTSPPPIIPPSSRQSLRSMFPEVKERRDIEKPVYARQPRRGLYAAGHGQGKPPADRHHQKVWVPANDDVDMLIKGQMQARCAGSEPPPEGQPARLDTINCRRTAGLKTRFNTTFFTSGDSREPELAGIWGAVKGSFYSLLITLLLVLSDRRRRRRLSGGVRAQESSGPISSRSISTTWPPFPRSSSVCSAWRSSSTSADCPVRRRWSAAWS